MTPEEEEYVDTLDENMRSLWLAIEAMWNVGIQVTRAMQVQTGNSAKHAMLEWDEVPLDFRKVFGDAVVPHLLKASQFAAVTCINVAYHRRLGDG